MVLGGIRMKKMLLLLTIFVFISASAHAVLQPQVTLTVQSTQGIGSIMVFNKTANTPGVKCDGTTPCNFTFRSGTSVAITANSISVGFALRGWHPTTGSATVCSNLTNVSPATCTFTITANSSATAQFDEIVQLTVQIAQGTGTIHVKDHNVLAFDCTTPNCSSHFFKGSLITIQNEAGTNQQFGSYSGNTGSATACTANPCSFTMNLQSKVVTNFIQIP
jgi:Divergent InlB B-repeat domain